VPDQVELLLKRAPQLKTTTSPGVIFAHLRMDAINRAGNPALADARVRKAIIMAINRPSLAEHIVPGGRVLDAMCLPVQLACAYSTRAPGYDPEGAKTLLAEAGYADGFDFEIVAVSQTNAIATAVAGDLAAVGIRVAVRIVPEITLADRVLRGEVQASISTGGFGNGSGVHVFWRSNFARPQNDYWNDPLLTDIYRRGTVMVDDAERADVYRAGFDRINELAYMAPLVGIPTSFVHSNRIVIEPNPFALDGAYLYDIDWRR
jgi:peptide/nickel transport system substrate-binding protein